MWKIIRKTESRTSDCLQVDVLRGAEQAVDKYLHIPVYEMANVQIYKNTKTEEVQKENVDE